MNVSCQGGQKNPNVHPYACVTLHKMINYTRHMPLTITNLLNYHAEMCLN